MKVVALVQARMGSTRLPGKVLKTIVNKPMIELLLTRLSQSSELNEIVVATSDDRQNDQLQLVVESLGFSCTRGSEKDVLSRFYESAKFSGTEGDVVIGIDSVWKQRFLDRSDEDIGLAETLNIQRYGEVEYTGLVKFSPKAMEWISQKKDSYNSSSGFIDLLNDIQEAGLDFVTYDFTGNWAEMNEQNDLVHFVLVARLKHYDGFNLN